MPSLKTLGILTVLAFIFFPLISIVPGILLLATIIFISLSRIKLSPAGLDMPLITELGENVIIQEESLQEDHIDIEDNGESYTIYEKKTIQKKDISFEDARRYNLMNTNCLDICGAYEADKTKNRYKENQKHCMICKKWLNYDKSDSCPCCSSILRVSKKEKVIRDDEPIF